MQTRHLDPYGRIALEAPRDLAETFRRAEACFEGGLAVDRGAVLVDVGADIGVFAVAAARRSGGDLESWCFEPRASRYAALESNVWNNDWLAPGRHRAVNAAIDRDALADLLDQLPRVDLLKADAALVSSLDPSMWSRIRQVVLDVSSEARARRAVSLAEAHGLVHPRVLATRGAPLVVAARRAA